MTDKESSENSDDSTVKSYAVRFADLVTESDMEAMD